MIDLDKVSAAVTDLLTALDVDQDEHTRDTPRRVAAAWAEALAGYIDDPARHLAVRFTAPSDPGLVVVAGIRIISTCAHHLLPITGHATVAYRPQVGDPIVGLSKLARVVEGYARRLQVQERLTAQVAATVADHLAPVGAGCVITAYHGCMTLRGVGQPESVTTTHSWAGAWTSRHPDVGVVLDEHRRALPATRLV